MESFFEQLGLSSSVFYYIILPLLIFFARIIDVSISTIRIMFVMGGKKFLAPLLGFFEAFIWLLAIGQIMQNIDNFYSYIAYAGGFAVGTYVGMAIEEKIALGRVVMRIITRKEATELITFLRSNEYRYANISAEGNKGKVNVLFTVIKREELPRVLEHVKLYNPQAFYTVEGVKKASEDDLIMESQKNYNKAFRFLQSKRR
jgi:uncharacterized protein YebE (UPF0316 family)